MYSQSKQIAYNRDTSEVVVNNFQLTSTFKLALRKSRVKSFRKEFHFRLQGNFLRNEGIQFNVDSTNGHSFNEYGFIELIIKTWICVVQKGSREQPL